MDIVCKYCSIDIYQTDKDVHTCIGCDLAAHLSCMNDIPKPSRLKGDNLFSYQCKACNFEGKDVLIRVKLGWVQIIHLALYNLTLLGNGRQGFFRWKEEICAFIEKHWSNLMPDKSRTSTWASTVAGTLSVHSPKLFKSGQHVFKESGWWGLSEIIPPFQDMEIYKNYKTQSAININSSEVKLEKGRESADYGRGKRQRKEKKIDADNPAKVQKMKTSMTTKSARLCASEQKESSNLKSEFGKYEITSDIGPSMDEPVLDNNNIKLEPSSYQEEDEWQLSLNDSPMEISELDFPPSYELNSINFDSGHEGTFLFFDDAIQMISQDIMDEKETSRGKTSLNNLNELQESTSNTTPCHEHVTTSAKMESQKVSTTPLSIAEEAEFLQKINSCVNVLACDSSVRRLRRNLLNRKLKREMGLPVLFSLDECVQKLMHDSAPDSIKFMFLKKKADVREIENDHSKILQSYNHPALRGVNVLDRFQNVPSVSVSRNRKNSLFRLIGNTEDESCDRLITSPYTARVLKPYIRRDFHTAPPKLKLLNEIRERKSVSSFKRWPLDYCYVQPKHVPAVNALCSDFFWPGIDVTECLQYPEFSCVVLYRKLLIGFAFMVPDVSYNEAYISYILVHPDWRRSGIATNMIYHLIQTCMGKDITLHVSPTNPSMMLYQKFGFKAEVLILDFYDKYVREDYIGCKHAFLLRLQR